MQFPWGNFCVLHTVHKVQREQGEWKIKEKYLGRDNIESENMEMGKDRRCLGMEKFNVV